MSTLFDESIKALGQGCRCRKDLLLRRARSQCCLSVPCPIPPCDLLIARV